MPFDGVVPFVIIRSPLISFIIPFTFQKHRFFANFVR